MLQLRINITLETVNCKYKIRDVYIFETSSGKEDDEK